MRPVLLEILARHGGDVDWLRAETPPERALVNLTYVRTVTATAHGEARIDLRDDQPPFVTAEESVAALAARIAAAPSDALVIGLPAWTRS